MEPIELGAGAVMAERDHGRGRIRQRPLAIRGRDPRGNFSRRSATIAPGLAMRWRPPAAPPFVVVPEAGLEAAAARAAQSGARL
jgi:hypothetical protein